MNITERYASAVNSSNLKSEPMSANPCKKCGTSDRYKSGDCKVCAIERSREYLLKHRDQIRDQRSKFRSKEKDKLKIQKAAWYLKNAEKIKQYGALRYAEKRHEIDLKNKEWAEQNPKKILEHKKKWEAANPERRRITTHNYRSRKRSIGGRISPGRAKMLLVLQKGKCACCGKPLGENYHLDHIMPLALGGSNTDDNIQLLRQTCNLQKQAKHPVEFMQQRGFLL